MTAPRLESRVRAAAVAAVTLTCAGSLAAEAPLESSRTEEVEVERVVWPVYLAPQRDLSFEEACGTISPEDVLVEEGGTAVRVSAVELTPLPTLHALLLDTSSSMRPRIEAVYEAAAEYLRSVPEGDRIALLTFDDDVMLHVPPTSDRQRLQVGLAGIRLGGETAFHDALRDAASIFDDPRGRKIVVLMTDGEDTASQERLTVDEMALAVTTSGNMSIFPVWLQVAGVGGGRSRTWLEQLASSTGGELFSIRRAERVEEVRRGMRTVFDEIRSRRRSEGYVTFEPR